MKKTLAETVATYRAILRWNGESVMDLMEVVKRLAQTAPAMLMQPLPWLLHMFKYNRAMRFDLSRINEPILAIDKKGFAIVGSLRSLKVERLMTI